MMKKITTVLFLFVATLFTVQSAKAQSSATNSFREGSKVINLQIGFGSTLYGAGYKGSFPPISISYEQEVAEGKWGVGGYLATTSAKWGSGSDYWKFSYTVIGARGAYHFYTTDKIDTYGGLMLGYDIVSSKWKGEGSENTFKASGSGVAYAFFVGGRYYFSDHIGASAELGYGVSVLNLGLAFKF